VGQSLSTGGDAHQPIAASLGGDVDHAEAVVWDAERGIIFCGGEEGQLYSVTLDGHVEQVAATGGSLLGLALDAAGLVYACDAGRRAIVVIDPQTGSVEEVSRGAPGYPLTEPNGIAFDRAGNLYVTDSGHWGEKDGRILLIDIRNSCRIWSESVVDYPNGCVFRDGRLLVVESGVPAIVDVAVLPNGSAGPRRELCRLPACVPDQCAEDEEGNLFVGCYRPDLIWRITTEGVVSELFGDASAMALAAPTGCAFAGPKMDVLVATNYGARNLVAVSTGTIGRGVHRPDRAKLAGLSGADPQ